MDQRCEVRSASAGGRDLAGMRSDQARALDQGNSVGGMAARQAFLRDQGFEGDAVEVMLQDLAPSTIQRYEWHWKQFGLFCASKGSLTRPRQA